MADSAQRIMGQPGGWAFGLAAWLALATAALAAPAVAQSLAAAAGADPAAALVARGRYLYHAAGCENCHTDRRHKGAPLAGGRRLATPFGVFYAPNITPDPEHGIGRWREEDFLRALREGISPRGEHYYPVFPYTSYTRMTDEDLRALWAYLRGVPPVAQPNRPHELPWYLGFRPLIAVWKWLYFTPGPWRPDPTRPPVWNRGAYLVEAVGHCGECHTPRNFLGGLRSDLHLAGTASGPEGGVVPNITPDRATGIGRWRRAELAYYFETGMTPDGDFAGDQMAEVIEYGLSRLSQEDRLAMADYLLSLPPIAHAVRKPKKKKDTFEY
jgi:mono/diheme cytochrome c family protein